MHLFVTRISLIIGTNFVYLPSLNHVNVIVSCGCRGRRGSSGRSGSLGCSGLVGSSLAGVSSAPVVVHFLIQLLLCLSGPAVGRATAV